MDADFKERIVNAIVSKIEGVKDIKRRLDYLMNPDNIQTSSRLTEEQVQAVNECIWLADHFPQFEGLKQLALGLAWWRISLDGKGREEELRAMIGVEEGTAIEGLGIHLHPAELKSGKEEKKK